MKSAKKSNTKIKIARIDTSNDKADTLKPGSEKKTFQTSPSSRSSAEISK